MGNENSSLDGDERYNQNEPFHDYGIDQQPSHHQFSTLNQSLNDRQQQLDSISTGTSQQPSSLQQQQHPHMRATKIKALLKGKHNTSGNNTSTTSSDAQLIDFNNLMNQNNESKMGSMRGGGGMDGVGAVGNTGNNNNNNAAHKQIIQKAKEQKMKLQQTFQRHKNQRQQEQQLMRENTQKMGGLNLNLTHNNEYTHHQQFQHPQHPQYPQHPQHHQYQQHYQQHHQQQQRQQDEMWWMQQKQQVQQKLMKKANHNNQQSYNEQNQHLNFMYTAGGNGMDQQQEQSKHRHQPQHHQNYNQNQHHHNNHHHHNNNTKQIVTEKAMKSKSNEATQWENAWEEDNESDDENDDGDMVDSLGPVVSSRPTEIASPSPTLSPSSHQILRPTMDGAHSSSMSTINTSHKMGQRIQQNSDEKQLSRKFDNVFEEGENGLKWDKQNNEKPSIEMFLPILRVLGKGSFGKVRYIILNVFWVTNFIVNYFLT